MTHTIKTMKFEDMYKEYDDKNMEREVTDDIVNLYDSYEVKNWFEILYIQEVAMNSSVICKRLFSVSFFRANVDCQGPEKRVDPSCFTAWEEKYWRGLTRLAQSLTESDILRVYVSQELHQEGYSAKLCQIRKRSLQIFVMQSNSIGAQPGMLWRFLPFFDESISCTVIVVDIDEDISLQRFAMIKKFEASGKNFGRFVNYGGVDGDFRICRESNAKNYAAVLGSLVMCRPSRSQLSLSLLNRFILTFMKRSLEYEPTCSVPLSKEMSEYNLPIHQHTYGWGAHWTMYGFDERFLKHVLLYHFARNGSLLSFVNRNALTRKEILADLEFTRSFPDNTTLFFV